MLQHFFLAFRTPVRVTEPNPNAGVRVGDDKNAWPWEPVTTAAGLTTQIRGPTPSLQFHHQ